MKKTLWIVVAVLIVCCIGYFARDYFFKVPPVVHVAHPDTERSTTAGKVIGYVEGNNTHAWLGIPYAKPPVGDLRWKAPLAPEPWEDTLEALEICSVCEQFGGPLGNAEKADFGMPVGSEDCLYLNIFAPNFSPNHIPKANDRVPVMMWVHGGGNSVGHGGSYNGKNLAEKYDLIIVTINYRLGPLGWFSHPAIREGAGSAEDRSGNYGTLDIIRALTWIKNNISAFGGDPNNITVFGESAGAVDTLSMMLSPKAEGLFHKAISQSGMARVMPLEEAEHFMDDPDAPGHSFSSREVVNKLLVADGIATDRAAAKKIQTQMSHSEIDQYLREKKAEDILRVYEPGPFGMISHTGLIQDGHVLPKGEPLIRFQNARHYNPVPLMIGTNRDEYKLFMAQNPEFVKRYFKIIVRFKDENDYELFSRYRTDFWKAYGVDMIAESISRSNGKAVYGYRFDWDEEPTLLGMDMSKLVGAAHGFEIPFIFYSFDRGVDLMNTMFTKKNRPGRIALADSMSSYWAQFAYTGSPGKGRDGKEVEWHAWNNQTPESNKFIVLDTQSDGGIRMSDDTVTVFDVKSRLLSENGFSTPAQHCKTYVSLFQNTPLWNDEEYKNLGNHGCEN